MSSKTCPACGQPVRAGLAFCNNCGVRLDAASDPPQNAVHTQEPQTAPMTGSMSGAPTSPGQAPPAYQPMPTQPFAPPSGASTSGQWRVVAIAAVFALIMGIVAALMWPASAGQLVADDTVGPDGGTVGFNDGGQLNVPKGAVKNTQRIQVRKTPIREPARIGGTLYPAGSLPVYIFSPATLSFDRAVTIIFPLPADAVAGRIFVIRDGRLTLIAVVPSRDGSVRISVIGFSGGRLVISP